MLCTPFSAQVRRARALSHRGFCAEGMPLTDCLLRICHQPSHRACMLFALQDRVLLWNAAALEVLRELLLEEHMGSVTCLAFEPSPPGREGYLSRVVFLLIFVFSIRTELDWRSALRKPYCWESRCRWWWHRSGATRSRCSASGTRLQDCWSARALYAERAMR